LLLHGVRHRSGCAITPNESKLSTAASGNGGAHGARPNHRDGGPEKGTAVAPAQLGGAAPGGAVERGEIARMSRRKIEVPIAPREPAGPRNYTSAGAAFFEYKLMAESILSFPAQPQNPKMP
jgi:hypothetical protein